MKKVFFLFLLLVGFFSLTAFASEGEKNGIIVCKHGLDMLDFDLEFIRHAEQSIELSGSYSGGKVLRDVLDAVEGQIQKHPQLKCYLLTSPRVFGDGDQECIEKFKKRYPNNFYYVFSADELEIFPTVGSTEHHVKTVIIDEKYYSLGGTSLDEVLCSEGTYTPPRTKKGGITTEKSPAGFRDQDVVGRGPIAKEIRQHFYKLFAIWKEYAKHSKLTKDPDAFKDKNDYFTIDAARAPYVPLFEESDRLVEGVRVKMVTSGPHQKTGEITKEYERQIKNAKRELSIGNLYFQPVSKLMDAFKEAAKRGIKISLITNGVYDDSPWFHQFYAWGNRINYCPLYHGRSFNLFEYLKAKKSKTYDVKIYEYRVPDVSYHKKVMVIDKKRTIIGSYNLGTKSDNGDYEIALVIESEQVAKDLLAILELDKKYSETISASKARDWYFDPTVDFIARATGNFRNFF